MPTESGTHTDKRSAIDRLNKRSIDPSSPTPLYYQLYTMLHDAISSGELPRGSRMPSEKELAANFDVSRITARRALDELALRKMVARHRGRGTFVDYRYQPDTMHAPLTELMQSIDHMWRDTKVEVIELDFSEPPTGISDEFRTGDGETLCHQIRVRSKQGVPFAHYVTWTRGFNRRLTKAQLEKTSRLELLKRYGIEFSRVEQFLSAEGADTDVAQRLGVSTGKPLLKLTRYAYDKQSQLLDKLTALYNPDLFLYRMETVLD
ncbi:MAG: GntR family transcriptional regulator [Pseudomonadota bacterium]